MKLKVNQNQFLKPKPEPKPKRKFNIFNYILRWTVCQWISRVIFCSRKWTVCDWTELNMYVVSLSTHAKSIARALLFWHLTQTEKQNTNSYDTDRTLIHLFYKFNKYCNLISIEIVDVKCKMARKIHRWRNFGSLYPSFVCKLIQSIHFTFIFSVAHRKKKKKIQQNIYNVNVIKSQIFPQYSCRWNTIWNGLDTLLPKILGSLSINLNCTELIHSRVSIIYRWSAQALSEAETGWNYALTTYNNNYNSLTTYTSSNITELRRFTMLLSC